jgi:hypothetical protein
VRWLRQRSVSGGNGDEAEWDNNASVSTKSVSIVAADKSSCSGTLRHCGSSRDERLRPIPAGFWAAA